MKEAVSISIFFDDNNRLCCCISSLDFLTKHCEDFYLFIEKAANELN